MVARSAPSRPIRVTVTFAARLDHRCFAYLRVGGRVRLRICKARRHKGGRLDKSGRGRSAETPARFARGSRQPGVSDKPNAPAIPGPPCGAAVSGTAGSPVYRKIRRCLRGRVLACGCGPLHPLVSLIFQLTGPPPALAGRQSGKRGVRFASLPCQTARFSQRRRQGAPQTWRATNGRQIRSL